MKKGSLVAVLLISASSFCLGADAGPTWMTHCASCHGPDGSGRTAKGRKLGTKNYQDPDVQTAFSDPEIAKAIKDGVKTNGRETMPPFGSALSETDIKALVAYIRAFRKQN